jgi:hypothetical protein
LIVECQKQASYHQEAQGANQPPHMAVGFGEHMISWIIQALEEGGESRAELLAIENVISWGRPHQRRSCIALQVIEISNCLLRVFGQIGVESSHSFNSNFCRYEGRTKPDDCFLCALVNASHVTELGISLEHIRLVYTNYIDPEKLTWLYATQMK